jgi:transcription-repair coupling factor (superfamily II helicase)
MPQSRVSGFFRQLAGLSLPEPGATVTVEELSGSAPYFWAAAVLEHLDGRTLFFITENNEQAEQGHVYFQSAARILSLELPEDGALVYPDYECSSLFDYTPLTETQTEQIQRTQQALLAGHARIVFLPYRALFRRTLGRELTKAARLQLKQTGEGTDERFPQAADTIDPAELVRLLAEFGYEHSNTVVAKGQFSRRGGIVDVFPFTSYYPVRLDFFGDEIESVKSFDPATQRSVQPVGGITILPADPAKRVLAQPYALDAIEGHLERFHREMGRALSENARRALDEAVENDLSCIREGRSFPRQSFYVELAGARNETRAD